MWGVQSPSQYLVQTIIVPSITSYYTVTTPVKNEIQNLLKEESKLVGYHPHKSCEIMGRYQNTEKYQLSVVFEHTGLSEFTLYRNKYAGMIIDGES